MQVGQDSALAGEQVCTELTHRLTGGNVFVVHKPGFCNDAGFDGFELVGFAAIRRLFCDEALVQGADSLDAPEEIDGCGAGLC